MTKENSLHFYNKEQKFYNKVPFPSQLRMVIIGISKSGKRKLLFKFLLKRYLAFHKIVFVSPNLSQKEYYVIIKLLQNGLNINKIKTIF